MNTGLMVDSPRLRQMIAPVAHDDDFAIRVRIAVVEDDRALRSVIVVSLLRLGCIIRFAHAVEPVCAELRDGTLHGAIIAGDWDAAQLQALCDANTSRVPLVILTNTPHGPRHGDADTPLRFLPKPFDMRELFALLHLDHLPVVTSGQRSAQ